MNKFDAKLKDIKPKDLIFVILYGGVISILIGFMIGLIDYYITSAIGFSFSIILFFFSAQFIGNQVRKQYEIPHIVYTVITGIFLVAQAIIIYGMPYIYTIARNAEDITILFHVQMYFTFLIAFFRALILSFDIQYLFIILVVFVGTYVGLKRTY